MFLAVLGMARAAPAPGDKRMRPGFCQALRAAALLASCAAPASPAPARAGPETAAAASYHGFKIEFAGFGAETETQAALALVRGQIDMVERVGLSPGQLAFFRSLKLRISGNLRGFHGIYNKGEISLAPAQIDGHNPTLLHEYMHALHDKKLPGGFASKEIAAAYQDACSVKRYEGDNGAYFLTNSHEFFAVTATLYLWGSLPYNRPYARFIIRAAQPGYYKYLETLFGPR